MESKDIQEIKILSKNYTRTQDFSLLNEFFLIFHKKMCPLEKDSEENINQLNMFEFLNSNLQKLIHIKSSALQIINEIEDYLSKDNSEDQKICETCIYVLKEGLDLIQEKINIDEEQNIKDQLRESTTELGYLETPGEEDISSFFE